MTQNHHPPCVRRYLQEVEQALQNAAVPAEERAAVYAALCEQIAEMSLLHPEPSVLVSLLDPPVSFGAPASLGISAPAGVLMSPQTDRAVRTPARAESILGAFSLTSSLAGLVVGVLIGAVGGAIGKPGDEAGFVLFFGCQIVAIALGLIAIRHPIARGGLLAGVLLLGASLIAAWSA